MRFYCSASVCSSILTLILLPLLDILTYAVTFFSLSGVEVFVYPKQLARSDVICPDASNTCQTEI